MKRKEGIKWSPVLHGVAAITGVIGLLTLILWWITLWIGWTPFGVTQDHIYNDAVALLLVSIAFGIGALIHQNQEKK